MEKLVPYSLYIPLYQAKVLREKSKEDRGGARLVREAIDARINNSNQYDTGYTQAIRDACKIIESTPEAGMVLIGNERLKDVLIDNIRMLEKNGK